MWLYLIVKLNRAKGDKLSQFFIGGKAKLKKSNNLTELFGACVWSMGFSNENETSVCLLHVISGVPHYIAH